MKTVALFLLIFSTPSFANELRLFFLKSPVGINWKTPWTLTTSVLKNQIIPMKDKRAYSISHVFIELRCDSNGTHIMRGMTSATNNEERELIFKKKYGLGTMFHSYKGKLEKENTIADDLLPYEGSPRRAELAFKVSGETCERMVKYVDEFESRGYGGMYSGLQADPLKGEGAGCSAFAVSFMRVGGLMDSFTEEWKQKLHVPKRFVGGPLTGNRVGMTKILSRPRATWNEHEPNIYLEAWDPEAMHDWVSKTYDEVQAGNYEGEWSPEVSKTGQTYEVKLDMSERKTPIGDFWI